MEWWHIALIGYVIALFVVDVVAAFGERRGSAFWTGYMQGRNALVDALLRRNAR